MILATKIDAQQLSMEKEVNNCQIDNQILLLIASAERCNQREIGYPYLISFNSKKEKEQARKIANFKWIDNRTADCLDAKNCTEALTFLLKNKITNLDLGPYQLNYIYQKLPLQDYFNVKKSYEYACGLIYQNIKKYGYSWDTIAMYHSHTKKHKEKYLRILSANIKKLKSGALK
ncbi:hypothetical protein [Sulfurimonas indica]|uniref:hypothetical protein n=1 Tax=Sulfurimonas TaxID=202746 RepID=UPI001265A907|nr:hypothetical protein [Sulfurimonas indica]